MPRQFPTIHLNDPSLELSQNLPITQDLGNEEFVMGDNYSAVELKPVNQQRQGVTWNWEDITIDQFELLRNYFMTLNGDYILWTPEGQTVPLKWRPVPGVLNGAFSDYDKANLSIRVRQVFDHG